MLAMFNPKNQHKCGNLLDPIDIIFENKIRKCPVVFRSDLFTLINVVESNKYYTLIPTN